MALSFWGINFPRAPVSEIHLGEVFGKVDRSEDLESEGLGLRSYGWELPAGEP